MNYYNENDLKTATWLRELINQKLIPEGDIDVRSIVDVQPSDLRGYTQCHFFAGIGGWSYALHLAGWEPSRPVWTGSCPCQPFSSGGNSRGTEDSRHLWPHFEELIKACCPVTIFGEQVARAISFNWFDVICAGLETEGYTIGASVLGAHSKSLPHVRQRLFWVANSNCQFDFGKELSTGRRTSQVPTIWESSQIFQEGQGRVDELVTRYIAQKVCSYSEARTILDGIPNHMALLRGAGNAIVPQVAAEFIKAFCEIQN